MAKVKASGRGAELAKEIETVFCLVHGREMPSGYRP